MTKSSNLPATRPASLRAWFDNPQTRLNDRVTISSDHELQSPADRAFSPNRRSWHRAIIGHFAHNRTIFGSLHQTCEDIQWLGRRYHLNFPVHLIRKPASAGGQSQSRYLARGVLLHSSLDSVVLTNQARTPDHCYRGGVPSAFRGSIYAPSVLCLERLVPSATHRFQHHRLGA